MKNNRPVDNALRGRVSHEALQQGAVEKENKKKIGDILREAFGKKIARQGSDLQGLVREGSVQVERQKFKAKVRSAVWDKLDGVYAEKEIVEEVTERLVEVAENDPHYRKLFYPSKKEE